jgi:hypothetical protein
MYYYNVLTGMGVITSLLISENTTIGEFMDWLVGSMVFNATFNNIFLISWRSALLVEKTSDLSQVTEKLNHIMRYTSP